MRKSLCPAVIALVLLAATPARAQLRTDASALRQSATTNLGGTGTGFSLNKLFSPAHFRMGHSFEMTAGSYGGSGYSLGVYTNSLMWQFNQKLAARVDMSVATSPFGNAPLGFGRTPETAGARFFVQNAELAYRPSKNVELHMSYRQSPYGGYASPYGYGGYGYAPGGSSSARVQYGAQDLFWQNAPR